MKKLIIYSKLQLTVSVLFFSLLFVACGDNKASALKKAEKAVTEDIKSVTKGAIDKISLGVGSMIMDFAMTSNEQDSLFISPMMPFVQTGLKSKTIKELEDIANIKKERYKFIGSTLFKNKEQVDSIENRMIIFPSKLEHAGTTHTNEKTRAVMNINYF